MRASRTWSVGLLLTVGFCVMLSGCISDSLNQYAEYDYGPHLGERLCHPYWDCEQGQWQKVDKSEIDAIVDYAKCEQNLEVYGEWFSPLVALGLEARRCMEMKGYVLVFPNPLRQ